ncbi:MAG: SdrD B-like domain-containing protein [Pseudomonadota bacterium]
MTLVGGLIGQALADGSETLGPASISVADGTGIATGGIGLVNGGANLDITIPAGASVVQALLYWEAVGVPGDPGNATDDTIEIGGNSVTGTLIGGPITINPGLGAQSTAYRADITSLNLLSPGANSLAVDGLDANFRNSGAGLLVVLDDGGDAGPTLVADGTDFAFVNAPPPRDTTMPQTFSFAAAPVARTLDLHLFFSNLQGQDISSQVAVTVDGTTTVTDNSMSSNGEEWNTLVIPVDVPAGVGSLTVQALSDDNPGNLSSFTWITAAVNVPMFVNRDGQIGDQVWKDLNGNGIREDGEPGVAGFPVRLLDDVGNEVQTTTTDGAGIYGFDHLDISRVYQVEFVNDPAMNMPFTIQGVGDPTTDSDADADGRSGLITLTADDPTDFSIDAGLQVPPALGGIGDLVFEDVDGNGQLDAGEAGVDGITVNLLDGAGAPTGMSTTTAGGGLYEFSDLPAGDYIVEFDLAGAAFDFTAANQGDPASDSDADPATGRSGVVSLAAGDFDLTIDAGIVAQATGVAPPACKLLTFRHKKVGLAFLKFADKDSLLDYARGDTVIEAVIETSAIDHPDSAGPGNDDNLRDGYRYFDGVTKALGSSRQRFYKVRTRDADGNKVISYWGKFAVRNTANLTLVIGHQSEACATWHY